MITIDGQGLTLAELEAVARDRRPVGLHPEAAGRVRRSRALLEGLLRSDRPIYGVNTGFGRLADVRISPADQRALQRNMVRSHAAGVGRRLPAAEVRAIMLLRANTLARGQSGCRLVVVERLLDLLNHGVHPEVPEIGSVGASGDLAPLSHVALALTGEGRAELDGELGNAAEMLRAIGSEPLDLSEKEAVALINGTQATTGIGALALCRFARALDTADVAGAMSLEGLKGTPDPFRSEIHSARPHPGQIAAARRLWALLRGSGIRESHRTGDPRVQDAYSLRCMPQVHGAAREAYGYAQRVMTTEANSTTDNPLVLPRAAVPDRAGRAAGGPAAGIVLSGGNFHAQVVAQCLDLVAIAAADMASISERRIDRLLNPDLSGLPAFLTTRPGIRSGLMIAQVTAADALSEMRVLATPASIDSVSTSASQEDHVSMGMAAARKVRRSVELLEVVLAAEFLCAAQAVEFHRPLRAGDGVERALASVRAHVPRVTDDRPLGTDLEALAVLIRAGELSQAGVANDVDAAGSDAADAEPEGIDHQP
ncbi:MAG: histidine ammonia-lyase [Gemmatimonadota bacterium]|nr:histidine ammonia-lyase [Gemmatimonadota bacterium]